MLGAEIRRLRLVVDMPLRELARRLSISAAHLSDIEHGRRMPSDQLLQGIARELGSAGTTYDALRNLDPRLEDDLEKWVSETPEVRQLLREAKDSGRPVRDVLKDLRELIRDEHDQK